MLAAASGDSAIDLSQYGQWKTLADVIVDWERSHPIIASALRDSAPAISPPIQWLAPIPSPSKFLLLAGNYRAHVVESGFAALPEDNMTPQFFSKPNTAIAGPLDSIPLTKRNTALDYEAELAVVMGQPLKNASGSDALRSVWGTRL